MRTSVLPQLGCGLECLFVVFHRGHRSQVNLTTAMPTYSMYRLYAHIQSVHAGAEQGARHRLIKEEWRGRGNLFFYFLG